MLNPHSIASIQASRSSVSFKSMNHPISAETAEAEPVSVEERDRDAEEVAGVIGLQVP